MVSAAGAGAAAGRLGEGGYFFPSGTRSVVAPGRVVQNIRIARDGYLGYGPADRVRLLGATRRASRHLAREVSFRRQTQPMLKRAIVPLEDAAPASQQCIGCWGACALLSAHLRNVSGDARGGDWDAGRSTLSGSRVPDVEKGAAPVV